MDRTSACGITQDWYNETGVQGRMELTWRYVVSGNSLSQRRAMSKVLCILLFFTLVSCIKGLPVKNTSSANGMETEQEPEWLMVGGQKVYNFEQPRQYEYYLKSEAENVTGVRLLINPKSKNIATNLEGIEQLVNLQRLYLLGLNLDELDYSPLRTLQNIERITFDCGNVSKMTKIPDLSFMASRDKIKEILFAHCTLANFDNIEFFHNLRFVEAWNATAFDNLKALDNLQYLETLRISTVDSIFRIEDIPSLINLKELLLHGKQIDVKGIENLTVLEEVRFFKSEIINTVFISELRNLQWLEMIMRDKNPDIRFLNNMKSLKKLKIYAYDDIWDNMRNLMPYQVIDISPIGSLSQLNYLELHGFILQNIAVLDGLNNLEKAYVYYSVLKDDSERTEKHLVFSAEADGH